VGKALMPTNSYKKIWKINLKYFSLKLRKVVKLVWMNAKYYKLAMIEINHINEKGKSLKCTSLSLK